MAGQMTGGSKRTWLFDHTNIEEHQPLLDKFVHYDVYFEDDPEEQPENTLVIVIDKVLEDLPTEIADAVRLVYLSNQTYRGAGRMLGIDHKTVKSRAMKGVEMMRERLVNSLWVAEMLRGYIPSGETEDTTSSSTSGLRSVVDMMSVSFEDDEDDTDG